MKYEVLTENGETVDIVNATTERGLKRSLKNLMESMYESTVLAITVNEDKVHVEFQDGWVNYKLRQW